MIVFGAGAREFLLLGCLMSLAGFGLPAALAPTAHGAGLAVKVTPVAGEPYAAELQGVTDQTVQLVQDGEQRSVPMAELSRIERAQPAEAISPPMSVQLSGGSRLRCEAVLIADSQATVRLAQDDQLQVPLERLQWIRFRPPSPGVDDAWLGLLGEEQPNDILVIRRSADTIDQVSGIVVGADAATVRFAVGEQEVPAPVARLEGIIFGSSEAAAASSVVVVDVYGSQWSAVSLEMANADGDEAADGASPQLRMELAGGVERLLPLEQVGSIRLEGNVQLLATETPVESMYTPLIELPLPEDRLLRWLGPKADGDRDLVLRSRSSVTYRIEPKYRAFATRIVPDERVAAGSGCEVRVLLDGRAVWSETVQPADDPRGVEIDLADAERLTLEVDYGQGQARSDVGDVIRFIQPRLLQ